MTTNLVKQAAPANVSTPVRSIGVLSGLRILERNDGATARAVIRGSRLFNTVSGLPRTRKKVTKSSGAMQSGSPPGAFVGTSCPPRTPLNFPFGFGVLLASYDPNARPDPY